MATTGRKCKKMETGRLAAWLHRLQLTTPTATLIHGGKRPGSWEPNVESEGRESQRKGVLARFHGQV